MFINNHPTTDLREIKCYFWLIKKLQNSHEGMLLRYPQILSHSLSFTGKQMRIWQFLKVPNSRLWPFLVPTAKVLIIDFLLEDTLPFIKITGIGMAATSLQTSGIIFDL